MNSRHQKYHNSRMQGLRPEATSSGSSDTPGHTNAETITSGFDTILVQRDRDYRCYAEGTLVIRLDFYFPRSAQTKSIRPSPWLSLLFLPQYLLHHHPHNAMYFLAPGSVFHSTPRNFPLYPQIASPYSVNHHIYSDSSLNLLHGHYCSPLE